MTRTQRTGRMRYSARIGGAVYQNDRYTHCTEGIMAKFRASVMWRVPTLVLALAILAILTIPAAALAQGGYFGRNKVQYRTFKFQVLKTEHFDIHFYPEEEAAARMTARMAERWYARLSKLLNHELRGRQPVILYASAPHFWQTTAIE